MSKGKLYITKGWVIPIMALCVFGLTRLFISYPHLAEDYYSQTVYPQIAAGMSFFSRMVPFSLDDIFYFLLIAGGLSLVVLLIVRKITFKRFGMILLNSLAAVYILFYLLWGFNYFREDVNTRLDLKQRIANQEEFMQVFRNLVEATNNTYTTFYGFDKAMVAKEIEASYSRLDSILNLNYPSGSRKAKPITLSGFFAQAGISGYFGPFFNEVHINKKLLPVEYPFVLAHEKAHQFGITGESEANFYAWLVCSQSSSRQLQYSANLIAMRYFMYHGYRLEGYREVISLIDEQVIADIRRIQEHWQGLRNEKVEAVAERVNDAYLKTNQVEKGIRDYTGIVQHIMDYALDNEFPGRAEK